MGKRGSGNWPGWRPRGPRLGGVLPVTERPWASHFFLLEPQFSHLSNGKSDDLIALFPS